MSEGSIEDREYEDHEAVQLKLDAIEALKSGDGEMDKGNLCQLEKLVELIKTQETYATADPIYLVQRREWVPLHDDYRDDADRLSVRDDLEGEEATPDETAYVMKLYTNMEDIPNQ
jgi:hypothetical protein